MKEKYYNKRAVYIGRDGRGRTGTAIKDASTGPNHSWFVADNAVSAIKAPDDNIWFDEDGYQNWNPCQA